MGKKLMLSIVFIFLFVIVSVKSYSGMASCSSVAVCFRLGTVADLISLVCKVYKPGQEKSSDQAEYPVLSYIIDYISYHLQDKVSLNYSSICLH